MPSKRKFHASTYPLFPAKSFVIDLMMMLLKSADKVSNVSCKCTSLIIYYLMMHDGINVVLLDIRYYKLVPKFSGRGCRIRIGVEKFTATSKINRFH